ncbi:S8 family serine peptidase [uncultured Cellulomonas sp.]|uniref:S8 family serine peptidase n=1 Tax=uncultured Cellulomonas sp. TaxID=189682 RepID=UPI0028EF264E|nr:S8 family serine peptidase [uncultured Cellulomonas sp.]
MKLARAVVVATVFAAMLCAGFPAVAAPRPAPAADAPDPRTTDRPTDRGGVEPLAEPAPSTGQEHAPDRVLVSWAPRASSSQRRSALDEAGVTAADTIPGTTFTEVAVGDADPEAVVAELADDPRVAAVQLDHVRRATQWTADPAIEVAWPYLDLVRLPRAWDVSTGTGVTVAVLDTGVSATHEDLAGGVLSGIDLVAGDTDASDPHGHGTLVAGIVAARGNTVGSVGAAHSAAILPVRVLDQRGEGTDSTVAAGIGWAVANGAKVLNLSLGGPDPSPVLLEAIRSAVAAGAVVVVAAGNEGTDAPQYPAAYAPQLDGLLAVGATDDDGALTDFSSWGDWVSIAAPGYEIVGPGARGGYVHGSGTSFAAPFVAGAAALLLQRNGALPPAAIEGRLEQTARDAGPRGMDPFYGFGVLDTATAVTAGDSFKAAAAVPLDRAPGAGGPDETAATAERVAGTTVDGTISPEGDADWHLFRVPTAGSYRVTAGVVSSARPAGALQPTLEVRSTTGDVLGTAGEPALGGPAAVTFPMAGVGDILVKVANGNGSASDAVYRLTLAPTTGPTGPAAGRAWVSGITPAPHSSGTQQRPVVTVSVDRDLREPLPATVRIVDATGATVPATVTYATVGGRRILLTPTVDLTLGGHYEVLVDGLTDTGGQTQDRAVRSWFTVAAGGDRFTPVDPVRIADTRTDGQGSVASGEELQIDLSPLPADATSVVLSVVSAGHGSLGNIRVFPTKAGAAVPTVASLNLVPGVDQPNLVTVAIGEDRMVSLVPDGPTTHLIVDLFGYYSPGGGTGFQPLDPTRVLDTRNGTGVPTGPVTGGHWVDLAVAGTGSVPADASAVVLNVAGTIVAGRLYVSVYPRPEAGYPDGSPGTSNLNLYPGRDQSTLVTVKVGDGGRVRFWVNTSSTHLVADLAGYYSATGDNGFVPVTPVRVADTRTGSHLPGILRAGVPVDLELWRAPFGTDATSVVLNIAGVGPRSQTHVRAFPTTDPATLPLISTINLAAGRDESNLAIVRVGDRGRITFYAHSSDTHLVVDAFGYFRTYR